MGDVVDIPLDVIIAKIRRLQPEIMALGVTRLAVFGSRARGDARADSDLDILVDATARGKQPSFDLFEAQHVIEDATGIMTQVSVRDWLKPRVAERISDDLVEVF
jgi:uncharacterized protein